MNELDKLKVGAEDLRIHIETVIDLLQVLEEYIELNLYVDATSGLQRERVGNLISSIHVMDEYLHKVARDANKLSDGPAQE